MSIELETSYGGVVVRGDELLVITPTGKRVTGLPKGGMEAGETPEQAAATFRDVFAVAEFRALWLAQLLSVIGDQLARVALTVLVYQQTRSPALAASVMALSFLPYLVGGLLLGAIEIYLQAYLPDAAMPFQGAITLGVVILVLVLRPQGLIGPTREMAR